MNFIPVKTERLVIRKTLLKDVDLLLKMDKQEITQKYLGGIKNKTRKERLEFLRKDKNSSNTLSLTILLDKPIGFIRLKFYDDRLSLSYIFDSDYINNGYCTEAVKKIIDICFNELNINSIIADTKEENLKSINVLNKLGFKFRNIDDIGEAKFLNYILKKD